MNQEMGPVHEMAQAVTQQKIPLRQETAIHHQETGGRFGAWLYRVLSDPQPRITEQGRLEHVQLVLPRKQDGLDRFGQRVHQGWVSLKEGVGAVRNSTIFQRQPMEAGFTAQAYVADRDPNTPVAGQSENTGVLIGTDASPSEATAR